MHLPLRLVLVSLAAVSLAGCAVSPAAHPPAPAASAAADRGDRWAEASLAGAGEVTVLYVPADGWAYRGADGRLTGVTVEIVRMFAEHVRTEHGVDLALTFVEEPEWRTFYGRVREGTDGVFGIGNVTITAARRAEIQFSPPYLTNVASLITHSGVPELQRLEDMPSTFAGLSALAFAGTLHEARLRRFEREFFPGVEVALAESNREILDRVAEGGYFAYVDAYNYRAAVEAGAPLRHHPVAEDAAEEFGIVMPLGSDWGPVLAGFFAHGPGLRRSDAYRALLVEHLGAALAEMLVKAGER
jgi:ABC-type amino acid transport substrate-binding protein